MNQLLFFRVFKGTELISVKQLHQPQVVFGNSSEANIQLNDNAVSQVHTMIEERSGKYFIFDLGTPGGTKLNGNAILDHELNSGDEITIGPFRIEFFIGLPKPKSSPSGVIEHASAEKPVSRPDPKPIPAAPPVITPQAVKPKPSYQTPVSGGVGMETAAQRPRVGERLKPGTFAPPSNIKDVYEVVKPAKGNVVEVIVVWNNRIIQTHQFEKQEVISVGSHPSNKIILPVFGTTQVRHPLVKIHMLATVFITSAMHIEVTSASKKLSQSDLQGAGRLTQSGVGSAVTLDQGEMAKIDMGMGLSILIRYAPSAGKPIVAPFFDFSNAELVGVVTSMVIAAIMGLYLLVYSPNLVQEDKKPDEPPRKAQFLYHRREPIPLEENAGMKDAPKEVKKMEDTPKGAASDAPKSKSKSQEVNLWIAHPKRLLDLASV